VLIAERNNFVSEVSRQKKMFLKSTRKEEIAAYA
jgi:hypothetical protein